MKKLMMLCLAVLVSGSVLAEPLTVKTMRLEDGGTLAVLDLDKEDAVKWLKESVAAAQKRLAEELPEALKKEVLDIELVSVPHPDLQSSANKMFVQWKHEVNPATFIPLVGRAVPQKLNVFVSLEARVLVDGRAPITIPGKAQKQIEYTKGLLASSSFFEALEGSAKPLMDEAISQVIAEAKKL